MSETYDDILDRQWDDIPEPQLLPVGSYTLRMRNATYIPAKEASKSPRVVFFYTPVSPMDDVDAEALAALGDDYDISETQVTAQFFVEQGRDWDAIRKHMEKHGVDLTGKSIKESFNALRKSEVVAYLDQRSYTNRDGETVTENTAKNFVAIE